MHYQFDWHCHHNCSNFLAVTFGFTTLSMSQAHFTPENFVILQSIGIIAIKSRETRVVIYTCRYSSGQFNP